MEPPFKFEELNNVTKKQLVDFLQQNANNEFLGRHKLRGKAANVVKAATKDKLDLAYKELFETKEFRSEEDDQATQAFLAQKKEEEQKKQEEASAPSSSSSSSSAAQTEKKAAEPEKKGYKKITLSKGDKRSFPSKGDTVKVYYKGMLEDGTVFDTNIGKKGKVLTFKVGEGRVIRGWDEALMEMSVGEKAKLTIEPEWAYGKKGVEGKIPPNSTLIFEVELVGFN
ncbi:FK506-binding protein 2B [Balamuthia mandrillaris]